MVERGVSANQAAYLAGRRLSEGVQIARGHRLGDVRPMAVKRIECATKRCNDPLRQSVEVWYRTRREVVGPVVSSLPMRVTGPRLYYPTLKTTTGSVRTAAAGWTAGCPTPGVQGRAQGGEEGSEDNTVKRAASHTDTHNSEPT